METRMVLRDARRQSAYPTLQATHWRVKRRVYSLLWVVFALLFSVLTYAHVSGPTSNSTGRYTLTLRPPGTNERVQFQGHHLRVYRNGEFQKTINLSLSARSYIEVVDKEGAWRYDHHVTLRECVFFIRGDCGEWDESGGVANRHTVTVNFARQPAPPGTLTNKITGPSSSITGAFSLRFVPPTAGSRLRIRAQKIHAYRNGTLSKTYTPSNTAKTFAVKLTREGTWRFDHRVDIDFCSIWVRNTCLEWDPSTNNGGSHTVNVKLLRASGTPASLSVPHVNQGTLTVSWGVASGRVSRYFLDYRQAGGSWTNKYSGAGRSTEFSGKPLAQGAYEFRLRACDEAFGQARCSGWRTAKMTVAYRPSQPRSLTPPSATNLTLTWAGSTEHVDFFDVDQQRNDQAWTSVYDAGKATRTVITGPSEGPHTFRVRACRRVSGTMLCSAFRSSASVTLSRPRSAPSLQLAANDTDGNYALSWKGIGQTTYYRVQEKPGTKAWVTLRDHAIHRSARTTLARKVPGNTSYVYRVAACNLLGCTAYSAVKTIHVALTPGKPGAVSVPSRHGATTLKVAWTKASGRVTRYDVQKQYNEGSWQPLSKSAATSVNATKLAAGQYRFRVRACNQIGSFDHCASAWQLSSAVTLAAPNGAPELNVPGADSDGNYEIRWNAMATTQRYELMERTGASTWSRVHNASAATYSASKRAFNQYRYRVRACNAFGCGAYSSEKIIVVSPPTEGWAQVGATTVPDHLPEAFTPSTHDATVGALAGQGSVSGAQALYDIPIVVPPGRAGIAPSLAVRYHSGGGNGNLGMGFEVTGATSAIRRCARTIAHDGYAGAVQYDSDTDRLCLDGQRLVLVDGHYGADGAEYRTELNRFARITQHGALNGAATWFKVEHKQGHIVYYGESADSRVRPDGAPATLSWLMKRQQDRASTPNSMRYHYQDFGRGEVRLRDIYYTGNGNADGDRRVQLRYEPRSDIASSYLAGGLTAQTQRLKTIATYYRTDPVREYRFAYLSSAASARSLLASVQTCGFDQARAVCQAKTNLSWHHNAPTFVLEKVGYRSATQADAHREGGTLNAQLQDVRDIEKVIPYGDINGDGSNDWPTWYADAEGVYQGDNTRSERSCRKANLHRYVCADGDINRDGRSDSWRVAGQLLQLSYDNTHWVDTAISMAGTSGKDGLYDIADYNADGWPDIVMSLYEAFTDRKSRQLVVYLHSGNTETPYSSAGIPLFTYNERSARNGGGTAFTNDVQLMGDLNGDQLPDMMVFDFGSLGNTRAAHNVIYTRLDAQGRPVFDDERSVVAHRNTLPLSTDSGQDLRDFDYFMDVNGDGLTDWIAWVDAGRLWLSLNRGDTTFAPWQDLGGEATLRARTIPARIAGEPVDTFTPKFGHALRQMDYDADGRAELLVPDRLRESVCLSRRVGKNIKNICGDSVYDVHSASSGVCFDIPGDILAPAGGRCFTNTFTSLDLATFDANVYQYKAYTFVEDAHGRFRVVSKPTELVGAANQTAVIDGFGNGLPDMAFIVGCRTTDTCTTNPAKDLEPGVYINRHRGAAANDERYQPIDILRSVENAWGVRDEWTYRPLSSRDPRFHSHDQPFYTPDFGYLDTLNAEQRHQHFHFSSSMYVVAEHRMSSGLGGLNAEQWRYKGAVYNWQGRGFQGFRTVIHEDITNGLRTQSDFHQIFPIAGRLERSQQHAERDIPRDSDLAADPIIETRYTWRFWPRANQGSHFDVSVSSATDAWSVEPAKPYFVGAAEQQTIHRTLDLTTRQETHRSTRITAFDAYGNITEATQRYQEPSARHQVTHRTTTKYTEDTATWWLNRPSQQVTVRDPIVQRNGVAIASGTDASQRTQVDYLRWDNDARKPEWVRTTPSSGKAITLTTVYNAHGLVSSATQSSPEESARKTTTTYSPDGYFGQTVTNALGHVLETQVNPRFGVPNWNQDANRQRVVYLYDAFGRQIRAHAEKRAPPSHTRLTACGGCGVAKAVLRITTEQAGTPRQVRYLDQLGRVLRTDVDGFTAGDTVVTTMTYNARGLKTFESVPHFATDTASGTHYRRYDAFGRLTEKSIDQTAGQNLEITYLHDQGTHGFTTEIQASHLNMARTVNGLEQLVDTVDAKGGVTTYGYDSGGAPIVVQDANQQRITSQYNALGQKDWVDDPNMGRKRFTYTGFGEVDTESDANGNVIDYDYDVLGRQVLRQVNGVKEAQWLYDRAEHGLGLLEQEARLDARFHKRYQYDAQSRPVAATTHIDGENFVTRTQYDSHYGRVKGLQYPNGLTLAYDYNARGFAHRTRNAVSGYVYRDIRAADAYGQWRQAGIAGGTTTATRQFHAETGQMASATLRNALLLHHEQQYSDYDEFGNLRQMTTQVPSASPAKNADTFFYDDLHRLEMSTRDHGATVNYCCRPNWRRSFGRIIHRRMC